MSIVQSISTDLESALREKKTDRVAILRLLKNALTLFAKDKRVDVMQLSDEQAISVLRSEAKKRRESIAAFTAGKRSDLADRESQELAVVEQYVPASMPIEDLKKIIADVIAEQQLVPPYQFGTLMGLVVKKVAGRADGATVKSCVENYIAES